MAPVPVPVVVDASALVWAVAGAGRRGQRTRAVLRDRRRHAPHLVDAEVGNALRRRVLRGEFSGRDAAEARRLAERLVHRRHPMSGALADAAWVLHERVTFYDALYVALAASLGAPLVTADERLARGVDDLIEVEAV